jgi:hypothetical protein
MIGQRGHKHVGVEVLKYYCDADKLFAFVDLQCGKRISILDVVHHVLCVT